MDRTKMAQLRQVAQRVEALELIARQERLDAEARVAAAAAAAAAGVSRPNPRYEKGFDGAKLVPVHDVQVVEVPGAAPFRGAVTDITRGDNRVW